MSEASLARRYSFKLLANVASVPLYLLMEAILPRALGPAAYGTFAFSTNLFQQISNFMDMGTSSCFYNSLSRTQHEHRLAAYYARFMLAFLPVMLLCGFAMWMPGLGAWLMPDVPVWIAPLAALWAYLTWLGRVLRSMNDALGSTVGSELARSLASLLSAALLLGLFLMGLLSLSTLFLQQFFSLLLLCVAFIWVMRGAWPGFSFVLKKEESQAYNREFFRYSHPLFAQALLSFFFLTAERWLLQYFDGSVQQGFFSLSQKVSIACFMFVSAMTPLIMREFSIAWGQHDTQRMGALMQRFTPMLFTVAAYFSCFTCIEAQSLVNFFGGQQFAAALIPVYIMALYPVHQASGQLATAVFRATGNTALLRNIACVEYLCGFVLCWFLLAPESLWGLSLGAAGLAFKTVLVQFLSVNTHLWFCSRLIPFPFLKNLVHQISTILTLLAVALLCRHLTMLLPLDGLLRFFLSGTVYTVLISLLMLLFPKMMGFSHTDLKGLYIRIQKKRSS